ncbi:MAG: hypothetical protein VW552_05395 [Ilumatobacter sp.]|jgi:hypothetical protein
MSSVEAAALRDRAAGLRRAAASARGFEVSALFASDGSVWSSPRVDRLVGDLRVAMSAITSLVASSTALATFVTSAGADR